MEVVNSKSIASQGKGMEGVGSKENILNIASSMMGEGKRSEAEKLLKDFVSEMPLDWKPVNVSTTSIDVAYWSMEEFMIHASHCNPEGSKKIVNWVGPSYSKAFYLLSFISVEQQDWPKAMLYIDQAIELEPDHPFILCEKAMILLHLGSYQEAYDLFIKASEIRSWAPKPQRARALRGAAISLIDLKRLDDAEDFLKKSLDIEPENEVALNELSYIEKLRKDQIKEELKDIIFKYRILCVDDDEVITEMISNYLIKQGYETFTASSAKEALDVLLKHHIDLVMTDVVMPGMDGLELTKIIKKNYDSYVIIFTGYKPICSFEKAINLGASDFFYKPFKFEDLLDSVRKILGTST